MKKLALAAVALMFSAGPALAGQITCNQLPNEPGLAVSVLVEMVWAGPESIQPPSQGDPSSPIFEQVIAPAHEALSLLETRSAPVQALTVPLVFSATLPGSGLELDWLGVIEPGSVQTWECVEGAGEPLRFLVLPGEITLASPAGAVFSTDFTSTVILPGSDAPLPQDGLANVYWTVYEIERFDNGTPGELEALYFAFSVGTHEALFADGFESGDLSAWNSVAP